jgi:hypothetical protein
MKSGEGKGKGFDLLSSGVCFPLEREKGKAFFCFRLERKKGEGFVFAFVWRGKRERIFLLSFREGHHVRPICSGRWDVHPDQ